MRTAATSAFPGFGSVVGSVCIYRPTAPVNAAPLLVYSHTNKCVNRHKEYQTDMCVHLASLRYSAVCRPTRSLRTADPTTRVRLESVRGEGARSWCVLERVGGRKCGWRWGSNSDDHFSGAQRWKVPPVSGQKRKRKLG